jgi:D-aspartate ligase
MSRCGRKIASKFRAYEMHLQSSEYPAVVLATAWAGGTIAATRTLGERGVPVVSLQTRQFASAAWSRFVKKRFRVPPETSGNFVSRLKAIGEALPGMVLLASSDQTAWAFAENRDALSRHFRIYQAPTSTITKLLDKVELARLCEMANVPFVSAFAPASAKELAEIKDTLPYPLLIKPRSHLNRACNHKGEVVNNAEELERTYSRLISTETAANNRLGLGKQTAPVLQKFVSGGSDGVHSISGFIDREGELFVTRRTAKVFLRSFPVGVGVCYEARPHSQELHEAAYRLCRESGYYGLFEIEFLDDGGQWSVIDFNPRLFNQIGLDIARGMPLPWFYWLAALGKRDALEEAVARARSESDADKVTAMYDRFTFNAILAAMSTTLKSSRAELDYWQEWRRRHDPSAVDVAISASDPIPGFLHASSEIALGLKAIPRFLSSKQQPRPTLVTS